jgi:hypothetical protein
MSVTKLYKPYAVNLKTATLAGSAVLMDQIQNFSIRTGIATALLSGDGAVDPTFVATSTQNPGITFDSTALATILAACGIDGAVIDADGAEPGLECWFQAMADGGLRASGSSHLKFTAKKGILIPQAIQASHGGIASMGLVAVLVWDGANDPIVIADNQALSGSPAVGEAFTVGPVTINGTTLEGIQQTTIDPGIKVTSKGGGGEVWPTFVGISSRTPGIVVRTTDVSVLATLGLLGTAQGATDSVVYLRKKAPDGAGNVADGTGEHISVTMDAGKISVSEASVNQDGEGIAEVVFTPACDGSNPIIAISTSAAIV